MCGSRFVTETESRYVMVELELKSVEWAVKNYRLYLIGFTLIGDHQPLSLFSTNTRWTQWRSHVFDVWKKKYLDSFLERCGEKDPITPHPMHCHLLPLLTQPKRILEREMVIRIRSVLAGHVMTSVDSDDEDSPGHLSDPIIKRQRMLSTITSSSTEKWRSWTY